MSRSLTVVGGEAADDVLAVVRAAFGARPPLDPPAAALAETRDSIAAALAEHGGILAREDGVPVGSLLLDRERDTLVVRRFGVVPAAQGTGVAGDLVRAAEEYAAAHAFSGIRLIARAELPASVAFWENSGFVRAGREKEKVHLVKVFPIHLEMATPDAARELGERLSTLLTAGDLLILSGDLGAGKTTFTKGVGAGLQVRGEVTSPTFVIARVHPSLVGGPALVHVDAYRLGSIHEIDDLDLEMTLSEAVTVVEWGAGMAEGLADDRLEIDLVRTLGGVGPEGLESIDDTDVRQVVVRPIGKRWLDTPWHRLT